MFALCHMVFASIGCLLLFLLAQHSEWVLSESLPHLPHHWGYGPENGPHTWDGFCNKAHSRRQSPIDIRTVDAVNRRHQQPKVQHEVFFTNFFVRHELHSTDFEDAIPKLHFVNYDSPGIVSVVNNGHAVQINGYNEWEPKEMPYIVGGGLDGKYILAQAHFHLSQHANGSEHTMNGRHFIAELHLVHIKQGLSAQEALSHSDGYAVIGVFFVIGTSGDALAGLEDALEEVVENGSNTTLPRFQLNLLLPAELEHFYRYNGSLTTPECNEVVVWTIMAEPVPMLSEQLDLLRALNGADGTPQPTNVRPIQPLNGRKVLFR